MVCCRIDKKSEEKKVTFINFIIIDINMSWVCSPSESDCVIRFYSIADDLQTLNVVVFDFIMSLTLGAWTTVILIFIISFIVALFLNISHTIKMQRIS
jgi:hypothetical protein